MTTAPPVPVRASRRKRKPRTRGKTQAPTVQASLGAKPGPQDAAPYHPLQLKRLGELLAIHTPFELACTQVGIKIRSAYEWKQRAEAAEEGRPIPDHPVRASDLRFLAACNEAEARGVAARLARITKAAQGGTVIQRRTVKRPDGSVITEERYQEPQWAADMTILERRFPEYFARKVAVQHGGEIGVVDFLAVVTEARRRADAKLAAAKQVGASSTPGAAALPATTTNGQPGEPPP